MLEGVIKRNLIVNNIFEKAIFNSAQWHCAILVAQPYFV